MRMSRVVPVLASLGVVFAACSGSPSQAPASAQPPASAPASASGSAVAGKDCDKPINIGVLVPYTGTNNADAHEIVQAAQLAVEDINAKGGVLCRKLAVVIGDAVDSRSDQVASAVNQLFSDPNINFMMTAYTSAANEEFEAMASTGMPYLTSANTVATKKIIVPDPAKYSMVWEMVPDYDAYNTTPAEQFDKWLRNTPGFTMPAQPTVYTISSDNTYSDGIAKGLNKTLEGLGWKVLGFDTVPTGNVTDWGASLAKIRANPPTLIINTDIQPSNEATFINQFRQNPTKSLVFMQYGPINAQFCELAGGNAEGVIYDSLGGPITGGNSESAKMAAELRDNYNAKYGPNTAGYFYGVGYWNVVLYSQALEAVGDPTNRAGIADWFAKIDTVTPSGHLKFDPATHLAQGGEDGLPLQMWQIGPDCSRPLIYPPTLTTDTFILPSWMK